MNITTFNEFTFPSSGNFEFTHVSGSRAINHLKKVTAALQDQASDSIILSNHINSINTLEPKITELTEKKQALNENTNAIAYQPTIIETTEKIIAILKKFQQTDWNFIGSHSNGINLAKRELESREYTTSAFHVYLRYAFCLGYFLSFLARISYDSETKKIKSRLETSEIAIINHKKMRHDNLKMEITTLFIPPDLKIKLLEAEQSITLENFRNNSITDLSKLLTDYTNNLNSDMIKLQTENDLLSPIVDELQSEIDQNDTLLSLEIAHKLHLMVTEDGTFRNSFTIGTEEPNSDEISQKIIDDSLQNAEIASTLTNRKIILQAQQDFNKGNLNTLEVKTVLCWNKVMKNLKNLDRSLSKLDRFHIVSCLSETSEFYAPSSLETLVEMNEKGIFRKQETGKDLIEIVKDRNGDVVIQSLFSLNSSTEQQNYKKKVNLRRKTYSIEEVKNQSYGLIDYINSLVSSLLFNPKQGNKQS